MPEQNGNTVNITLIFATQLNALKEFNRQKHIHVCYTALESYFRQSLFRPLSLHYGAEGRENLGPMIQKTCNQQKVRELEKCCPELT